MGSRISPDVRTFGSLPLIPQPIRRAAPKNSLLESTLDFMHCISASITTKSPSLGIRRAAVQPRQWKNAGGGGGGGLGRFGISELYVDALFGELPVNFTAQYNICG